MWIKLTFGYENIIFYASNFIGNDKHTLQIQESDQVLKIKRNFDEIYLNFHSSCENNPQVNGKVMQVIACFEPQVKELTIESLTMNLEFLMLILSSMRNLESLAINSRVDPSTAASSIILNKLKHLKVRSSWTLDRFTCPALEKLEFFSDFNENLSAHAENFIQRHSHLKQLDLSSFFGCAVHCYQVPNILSIDGVKLEVLDISKFTSPHVSLDWKLNEMSTFCSALNNQTELKILKLPITNLVDTNQLFHVIGKLQNLETLSIGLEGTYDSTEPIKEAFVRNVLRLKQLKVLKIVTDNFEMLGSMAAVENPRLEEFKLKILPYRFRPDYPMMCESFAENFHNLKKLSLDGIYVEIALNMASRLRNLTNFELAWDSTVDSKKDKEIDILAQNFKIRELTLASTNIFPTTNVIKACVQTMPNVSKLSYHQRYGKTQDNHIMSNFLLFNDLKEFKTDSKFLLQPQTIDAIKKQGQQLNKIIVALQFGDNAVSMEHLWSHYRNEFPIHALNNKKKVFVMMRA